MFVDVASCPVPAADYAGTQGAPQAAPQALDLPASLNPPREVRVFGTNFGGSTSYLVAPEPASCQALQGGDGSLGITATSAVDPAGRVDMTLSPGGLGVEATAACLYIPATRANAQAFFQYGPDPGCNPPPGDVIRQIPTGTANLYAAAVLVPVGVKDPNLEGDAHDPTVALFTAQVEGQDNLVQSIDCTLAPAHADICAASLKFFLATQADIRTLVTAANLTTMQAALSSFLADEGTHPHP